MIEISPEGCGLIEQALHSLRIGFQSGVGVRRHLCLLQVREREGKLGFHCLDALSGELRVRGLDTIRELHIAPFILTKVP